jgi:hypothetical protein
MKPRWIAVSIIQETKSKRWWADVCDYPHRTLNAAVKCVEDGMKMLKEWEADDDEEEGPAFTFIIRLPDVVIEKVWMTDR